MVIRCKDCLLDLQKPQIMGILNLTPDSFYDGGRLSDLDAALRQAEKMLEEGAALLDLGGASSRPGAEEVSETAELGRVIPVVEAVTKRFPEAFLSVDTWRGAVAAQAVAAGAHLVNDISAGKMDDTLYPTVAKLGVPYVLMHMQGAPQTMQRAPHYEDAVTEVLDFLLAELGRLRALGIKDVILDPGFGFGKSLAHNYTLLKNLHVFRNVTGLPILAGISRKSMVCKALNVSPANALNGSTALHMVALQQGANILRVHDVKAAREVVVLYEHLSNA